MERIDFAKQNIPFTQVANGVLYDKKLSLGSKTLYAFMYSKPDGWQFSAKRIADELGVAKGTILSLMNELKENGYLRSLKLNTGRMLYKVILPVLEPEFKNQTLGKNPESKKAMVQKSHGAKFEPLSNTDNTSNTDKESNTDIAKAVPSPVFIFSEYLKKMENSPHRHIHVIELYFEEKRLVFDSEGEIRVAIKRHLRPAMGVAKFTDNKILDAVDKAKKEYPENWTIETLLKILTR